MSDSRIFELRTYIPRPGKRDALLARVGGTASGLFKKYGVAEIGYWIETDPDGRAGDKIAYLLAYDSLDARLAAGKKFMEDPAWIEEMERGGDLIETSVSELLAPTDFSDLR